jgi:hypothetical protein
VTLAAAVGSQLPPEPALLADDELAACCCFDRDPARPPEIVVRDPRAVLEEEILRALQASPCLVAFSGGCDSGCILSLAVHLARREGLPEPVPFTKRYPRAHPDENEDAWQELVIRELGVKDWQRIEVLDDEIIGPEPARIFEAHGVLWPPALHGLRPIYAAARGGAVLTGEFGDELSQPWFGAVIPDLVTGRRRPGPRSLASAVRWAGPESLRRAAVRLHEPERAWLHEPLRSAVRESFVRDRAMYPWRADTARREMRLGRHVSVLRHNMAFVAGPEVEVIHPFDRQELFDWVALRFGVRGPTKRSEVLDALFGDCAPAVLRARRTKGGFSSVYSGDACRRFVESWEPRWWPSHLVDPDGLRAAWLADTRLTGTWTLLQLAWWSTRCEQGEPPRTLGEVASARPRPNEAPGG